MQRQPRLCEQSRLKSRSPRTKIMLSQGNIWKLCVLLFSLVFLFCPSHSLALTMSNDSYSVQGKTGDVPEKKDPPFQKKRIVSDTPTTGKNYSISTIALKNGLTPIFTLSVPQTVIDFGILSATNPVIRTQKLLVESPGSGYQLFAMEDHLLRSKNITTIPDTTCDNGSCTPIIAAPWTNTLTYGFGYRCEELTGAGKCTRGFEIPDMYKRFGNQTEKVKYYPIAGSEKADIGSQYQINYKINISGTQPEDAYYNSITYIAVPNF